jgi:hypothetical protein
MSNSKPETLTSRHTPVTVTLWGVPHKRVGVYLEEIMESPKEL